MVRRFARLLTSLLWLIGLPSVVFAQPPSALREVTVDGIEFRIPEGLTLSRVTPPDLIRWPIVADWDSQGRLVVAESGGVGWPIQEHNAQKLHRIVRLIDSDGDFVFDQRIVAADGLAFPEGVLCLGDVILVAAPPAIWRLTDGDGDGVCEQREVWFDGSTVTNCANDLHGPYLGRDGWIYWCKGAFGEQTHRRIDGREVTSRAAHIFRRRPDGGPIESVIAGGMDNPVEFVMTPEGERFFTSTFLVHPGGGQRDGIGHAVQGAVFGKDHGVVDSLPQTGPLMKPMVHLGPAAPSGLMSVESDRVAKLLGYDADTPVLLAALFNLHKLTAHRLIPDGASYRTEDRDLITTDRVDFHPTDVIACADGSLLLIDTGGWYDLCCPTSRVDQKTAGGGIYRLAREPTAAAKTIVSTPEPEDPSAEHWIAGMQDDRPWVRRTSSQNVVKMGAQAVEPLARAASDTTTTLRRRQNALWALGRIGSAEAYRQVISLLEDPSWQIRLTVAGVLSVGRVAAARDDLERGLADRSPQVRRVCAEALGRIGNVRSAGPLLSAFERWQGDRHLEHASIYALIELARRDSELNLLAMTDTEAERYAALKALAALGRGGQVDTQTLIAGLWSDLPVLRRSSAELLGADKDRAADSIEAIDRLWRQMELADGHRAELLRMLFTRWKGQPRVDQRIRGWIQQAPGKSPAQQMFLATHLATLIDASTEDGIVSDATRFLSESSGKVRWKLLESLSDWEIKEASAAELEALILDAATAEPNVRDRLRWLAALPAGAAIGDADLEGFVVSTFLDASSEGHSSAGSVLSRVKVSQPQADRLIESLDGLSPGALMTAIEAVRRVDRDAASRRLLQRLSELPAARSMPSGFLTNTFKRAPKATRELAGEIAEQLTQPPADIADVVNQTLAELPVGDAVRGLQVFRSSKAACSACHRMGYIGKNVGPELTRIGRSRTAEALLEAILFPSARLEQSFRSTRILTVDGRVFNGLMRPAEGSKVALQVAADRIETFDPGQIERSQASDVSVMPSGMKELLSPQELADLLALLQAAK